MAGDGHFHTCQKSTTGKLLILHIFFWQRLSLLPFKTSKIKKARLLPVFGYSIPLTVTVSEALFSATSPVGSARPLIIALIERIFEIAQERSLSTLLSGEAGTTTVTHS